MNTLLRKDSWIEQLSPAVKKDVISAMSVNLYGYGELIYAQGDNSPLLYQVKKGRVKLNHYSEGGREFVHTIVECSSSFGELEFLKKTPRLSNAISENAHTLCNTWRKSDFLALQQAYPEINQVLLNLLCHRYTSTLAMLQETSYLCLRQKIAHRLHGLAQTVGKPKSGGITINTSISQEEFGKSMGVSRQSINRELQQLKVRGLININGNHILVRDMLALKNEFCN